MEPLVPLLVNVAVPDPLSLPLNVQRYVPAILDKIELRKWAWAVEVLVRVLVL
jgi:hypothetical protein